MIENVMSRPGAYAVFGIVSVCLFFVVFGCAIVWAMVQPRDRMRRMGSLPLANDIDPEISVAQTDCRHE